MTIEQLKQNDHQLASSGNPVAAELQIFENTYGHPHYVLSGDWNTRTVGAIDTRLRDLAKKQGAGEVELDLSNVHHFDTAGAWLVARLISELEKNGASVTLKGQSKAAEILLSAVADMTETSVASSIRKDTFSVFDIFETVGRTMYGVRDDFLYSMHMLGATIAGSQLKLRRKNSVNPHAIIAQIQRMGVEAIPIVVLMSAIVGAIIAQQGAFQLRYFGAEIFVVDMVGLLVLRELGVLMTAIMIAGRSGSSITAEIGSMKMREEVDALTVIGLNPVGVLVFPRLVALVIALPCLTIIANFAALGGAILVSWLYSDISPAAFIERMKTAIDLTSIFSGLIKAPFMALVIGIIGSVEGMKVGGSAESLGNRVTASVVKSIFIVIVMDGLFAIFYASIDF